VKTASRVTGPSSLGVTGAEGAVAVGDLATERDGVEGADVDVDADDEEVRSGEDGTEGCGEGETG